VTGKSEEDWLREFVTAYGGVAGSVHVRQGDVLVLRNAFNLPPPVVAATRTIPKGKGMAGLAWERERPVTTCNLKTDETGDVRPGAKAVDAQGAVALPVRDARGEIRAVVGIAFARERDFTDEQLSDLANAAAALNAT
jgi:L-methionine (R)-S-oxide reductase